MTCRIARTAACLTICHPSLLPCTIGINFKIYKVIKYFEDLLNKSITNSKTWSKIGWGLSILFFCEWFALVFPMLDFSGYTKHDSSYALSLLVSTPFALTLPHEIAQNIRRRETQFVSYGRHSTLTARIWFKASLYWAGIHAICLVLCYLITNYITTAQLAFILMMNLFTVILNVMIRYSFSKSYDLHMIKKKEEETRIGPEEQIREEWTARVKTAGVPLPPQRSLMTVD